jgi:KaiC/GvpD/RAD55 family RecA-like ATPase
MAENADIRGLPLTLGGEIRAVSKLEGKEESTVILVRGPAGSGKTIFASHLAAHEALVRRGDVVFCCIELLPTELDAQLSGLTFGRERRPLRVCNLPFGPPAAPELRPRIFASLIDIPETGQPDFGAEVQRAMDDAREAQLTPRVIVIDSLAEGYRLVASMPRYLADALAKYAAEQGIVLILVEEVDNPRDSKWTFVADVVLELAHQGAAGTAAAEQRALTVRKNRFGPTHVGPHAFAIHKEGGIEVYPRPSVYLSATTQMSLPRNVRSAKTTTWKLLGLGMHDSIPQIGEVILLTGESAELVSSALEYLISDSQLLRLDFASAAPSTETILRCGDPNLSAERLISDLCLKLEELTGKIQGIVAGDLEAIAYNIDPDSLRRVFPILLRIARMTGLPVLLYETSPLHVAPSKHLAETIIRIYGYDYNSFAAYMSSSRRRLISNEVFISRLSTEES